MFEVRVIVDYGFGEESETVVGGFYTEEEAIEYMNFLIEENDGYYEEGMGPEYYVAEEW